jgi:hypothetical protein
VLSRAVLKQADDTPFESQKAMECEHEAPGVQDDGKELSSGDYVEMMRFLEEILAQELKSEGGTTFRPHSSPPILKS